MTAKRGSIFFAGSVAVSIGIALMLLLRNQAETLSATLDRFMRDEIGSEYRIRTAHRGPSFTDLEGMWALALDVPFTEQVLAQSKLKPADGADLDHYRTTFAESLYVNDSLDGFRLYRGEVKLGRGTICESAPCNVAMLVKPGGRNMYLAIWKN